MPETTAMATVSLHYWAGVRAAAGVEIETFETDTVQSALDLAAARRDPRFGRILLVSSILVNGRVRRGDELTTPLDGPVQAEVLPPFAGG